MIYKLIDINSEEEYILGSFRNKEEASIHALKKLGHIIKKDEGNDEE